MLDRQYVGEAEEGGRVNCEVWSVWLGAARASYGKRKRRRREVATVARSGYRDEGTLEIPNGSEI